MFTNPTLKSGELFPAIDEAALFDICKQLGASVSRDDILSSAAHYAIENWLPETRAQPIAFGDHPYQKRPSAHIFQDIGMVEEIAPSRDVYSHVLVDGGPKQVYDYRMAHTERLRQQGMMIGEIIMFGGQRLRDINHDSDEKLRTVALDARPNVDSWGSAWIDSELAKQKQPKECLSPWNRPFATEHQVGILTLMHRYGRRLEHIQTEPRKEPAQVSPELPPAVTYCETFTAEDQIIRVLDSPAIIRRYLGVELPVANARPTGSSCFNDWRSQLPQNSTAQALLITHNPNTYRSWHDVLLDWNRDEAKTISLDAAGAAIEDQLTHDDMMGAFGRLIVSLKRAADR